MLRKISDAVARYPSLDIASKEANVPTRERNEWQRIFLVEPMTIDGALVDAKERSGLLFS